MVKRKLINGAISGLAGTFVSRYNEISRYWAMGKLYAISLESGLNSISLDLINKESIPTNESLETLTFKYAQKFEELLSGYELDLSFVRKALIEVTFNVEASKKHLLYRWTYGQPYVCIVRVIDDLGTVHEHTAVGWCAPHNPIIEAQSTSKE